MPRLTVKAIEALSPGPARREIPDALMQGLYLVVQPTGSKSWAVRCRQNGRPREVYRRALSRFTGSLRRAKRGTAYCAALPKGATQHARMADARRGRGRAVLRTLRAARTIGPRRCAECTRRHGRWC